MVKPSPWSDTSSFLHFIPDLTDESRLSKSVFTRNVFLFSVVDKPTHTRTSDCSGPSPKISRGAMPSRRDEGVNPFEGRV